MYYILEKQEIMNWLLRAEKSGYIIRTDYVQQNRSSKFYEPI